MVASSRVRTIRAAVRAWRAHQPHQAVTLLRDAGFTRSEVDRFVKACHEQARRAAIRKGVAR